jgi:hypothetical protein
MSLTKVITQALHPGRVFGKFPAFRRGRFQVRLCKEEASLDSATPPERGVKNAESPYRRNRLPIALCQD